MVLKFGHKFALKRARSRGDKIEEAALLGYGDRKVKTWQRYQFFGRELTASEYSKLKNTHDYYTSEGGRRISNAI